MELKEELLSRRETVKLDRQGKLERWVVIEYMLGDFGPFTFEVKKDVFTYNLLKQDIAREKKGLAEFG